MALSVSSGTSQQNPKSLRVKLLFVGQIIFLIVSSVTKCEVLWWCLWCSIDYRSLNAMIIMSPFKEWQVQSIWTVREAIQAITFPGAWLSAMIRWFVSDFIMNLSLGKAGRKNSSSFLHDVLFNTVRKSRQPQIFSTLPCEAVSPTLNQRWQTRYFSCGFPMGMSHPELAWMWANVQCHNWDGATMGSNIP